jgi:hypothetical protein
MRQHSSPGPCQRKWFDSAHASLCVLGEYLRRTGFFQPLEDGLTLRQKVRQYTPVQKVEMVFVSLLAGAKAIYHTGTTLRVDPALQAAFGLPGCAEQSVLAETLTAATDADVAALRQVVEASFLTYSEARRHDYTRAVLVLDLDLSPLPASKHAEGSERGYMGRCRSKTGRKLVRVRAAQSQETVWEDVVPGNRVETLAVVQEAVAAAERLLGLEGDGDEARAKRARTEWRLDSGWGSEAIINWVLARGYQVTGKFKSTSRVRKLVAPIMTWEATSSPGREVAPVPAPVALARPCAQYAVRTPSKDKPGGYYQAVLFSSRTDLAMQAVVDHYDGRAGMEADIKGDKRGLGLGVLRKHKLAAQQMVVLLGQWAHNVLLWARCWLAQAAPRLNGFGIVRLVQEVWAVPGRVKLAGDRLRRVRLNPAHPQARAVSRGLAPLLAPGQTLAFLA